MKHIQSLEEFINENYINEEQVKENYAEEMQKEFESKSKYDYSEVLTAVRSIKDKRGWGAISNVHRLFNEIENELPGISKHLWDIQVGPVRSSVSHGKFAELFVNEKPIGNIFVK